MPLVIPCCRDAVATRLSGCPMWLLVEILRCTAPSAAHLANTSSRSQCIASDDIEGRGAESVAVQPPTFELEPESPALP